MSPSLQQFDSGCTFNKGWRVDEVLFCKLHTFCPSNSAEEYSPVRWIQVLQLVGGPDGVKAVALGNVSSRVLLKSYLAEPGKPGVMARNAGLLKVCHFLP